MNQVKEGQRVSKQVLTRRFITEVWTAGDGAQCGASPLPEGQPRFQRDGVASRRMTGGSLDRQIGSEDTVLERHPREWTCPLKMRRHSGWLECKA